MELLLVSGVGTLLLLVAELIDYVLELVLPSVADVEVSARAEGPPTPPPYQYNLAAHYDRAA